LFESIDRDDAPRLLLISSTVRNYELLLFELEKHKLTNLLALDRAVSPTELIVTTQKILRHDIFGLDKYFGWGVEPTSIRIRSSHDLSAAIDAATKFASDLKVHPRLIENTATIVDELITNALYNAPVDASGAPRFAHLPRTTPVELAPTEEVLLTFCCDGRSLGLAVTDSFGSMTEERSLEYLVKCLRREDNNPGIEKGGAGLGLYMAFDSVNHLVLNICQGTKTEVIGLIDIRGSYRDFVNRGKSFNIFLCAHDGQ
jgi:hypothetical protein